MEKLQKIGNRKNGYIDWRCIKALIGDKPCLHLSWIGKSKVVNHHLDVPYHVLERKYSYDAEWQHEEDNGSENMIIHGDNLLVL